MVVLAAGVATVAARAGRSRTAPPIVRSAAPVPPVSTTAVVVMVTTTTSTETTTTVRPPPPAGPPSAPSAPIAFASTRIEGGSQLYTMSPDGSAAQLRAPELSDVDTPAWSPDHTQIAFSVAPRYGRCAVDGRPHADLWVVAARAGATPRVLSQAPCGYADVDPAWSPDGKTLVFAERRDEGDSRVSLLYRVDSDGANRRVLLASLPQFIGPDRWGTGSVEGDRQPSFAPDGSVLFAREGTTDGSGIYRTRIGDGRVGRVLADSAPCNFGAHPTVSPDGSMIAFVRSADPDPLTDAIFTMRVDGTGLRRVTTQPGRQHVTSRPAPGVCGTGSDYDAAAEDLGPVWSPDGSHLAFYTNQRHRRDCHFSWELALVSPAGTDVRFPAPHPPAPTCGPGVRAWMDTAPAWR